jgi:hypothetical protein
MAYDPSSDRVILFGGRSDTDFGDTWAYEYNNDIWTQRSPEASPSPRHGVAMAFHAGLDRTILFGGVTATGDLSVGGETWIYNFRSDSWTMEKGPGPSNRFGATMAYVGGSDQIVLFGGSDQGDETWSHRLVS